MSVITVSTSINAPVAKAWKAFVTPQDIMKWNNASADWYTPEATNDLRPGGSFVYKMAAKDGSFAFDFGGTYDEVDEHQLIKYTLGDGRIVEVIFKSAGDNTEVTEHFEAEGTNPEEMQKAGWQAILDNFKSYVEGH